MAKYTVIGPSYRSGFNKPERAHSVAEQVAKDTGGEVTIVHQYEVVAKYGPEGRIELDDTAREEITIIVPDNRTLVNAKAFKGRLGISNIKGIIQKMRTEMGYIDATPFLGQTWEEEDDKIRVVFKDKDGFDVIFATLEDA